MCPLPRESGSDCFSGIDSEDRAVDAPDEDRTTFPDTDQNREQRLIRIANKKRQLLSVLQQYGLNITRSSPWDNWSASITCPLPTHKGGNERTPSFGYNFRDDYFHCFGCSTAGGSVEFIARKEGLDRLAVAEQIIHDSGGYEVDEELEVDIGRYDKILFEFAEYVSRLVQKYKHDPDSLKAIETAVWWLDMFLLARVPKQKVNVEHLEGRISRCKEMLQQEFSDE